MTAWKTVWLGSRAALFWVGFVLSTVIYGALASVLLVLPYKARYPLVRTWGAFNLFWLWVTCGVHYQVWGRENIPRDTAAIIMSNHQSTWETLAIAQVFPPLTWVLKRELLRIPFFGWGLNAIKPIAIDRGAGRSAVEQVKQQGKARLDEGISVVIFPEGTRVRPGVKARYKLGGSVLAAYAEVPVVPVAHNAGLSWPRHAWIKKPGMITLSIGKPIATQGRAPDQVNAEVENWIETEKQRLPPL